MILRRLKSIDLKSYTQQKLKIIKISIKCQKRAYIRVAIYQAKWSYI